MKQAHIDNQFEDIRKAIRDIPDFPKKGIIFKDITPVLQSPELFRKIIDHFTRRYSSRGIDAIVAIEARGFIFGAALAEKMGLPLIPIRKKGKLPYRTVQATYQLEYGTDTIEMHADALQPGQKTVIIDDLAATGGTAKAAIELVEKLDAAVTELAFVIELEFLNPRALLEGYDVYALVKF